MRTVLVIEDEVSVKNAICALLEREGWKVLHAATDADAIEQAARNSVIDLLITDVVLRSGNGVAVARQMIQDRPELLCILISGYPMADLYNRELMDDDLLNSWRVEFLEKPFTLRALLDSIGRMARAAA